MSAVPQTGSVGFAVLALWLLCAGCQPESWSLGDPEVMRVSAYELTTNEAPPRTKWRRWVYSSTDVLGVYPLPATVALPAGEAQTVSSFQAFAPTGCPPRDVFILHDVERVSLDGDPSTQMMWRWRGLHRRRGSNDQGHPAEDFESANRFLESSNSNAEVVRVTNPDQCLKVWPVGTSGWTSRAPSSML